MTFEFDIIQTIAIAVVALFIGAIVKSKITILDKMLIPNPVIGGILVSIVALIGYMTSSFEFVFDTTLQDIFMTVFFTAVGFSCDLKAFGRSGKKGLQLSVVIIIIILSQSFLGILIATSFGLHPLMGLSTSTAGLIGGHGTAGAFGPIFEDLTGISSLTTVALATATFGLIAGGLIGGPIGNYLIKKHNLVSENDIKKSEESDYKSNEKIDSIKLLDSKMSIAAFQIIFAMGLGSLVSSFLENIGLTFPAYMGALIIGLVIRNIGDYTKKYEIPMNEIDSLGKISLTMLVTMALMTLKLWQLADLAIPMIVILLAEVVLLTLIVIFIAYRILGKDYDAVVMITGICGFGLGAMPNAMANMQTFTAKFPPSPTAFFVIPAIGSLVIDFGNSIVLTFLMNLFT